SVITDWSTLGLGTWIDDLKVLDGAATLESNDFETDLGGWTIGPPPPGTDVPTNGWARRGEQVQEGGVGAPADTRYAGVGFAGINETARAEFMKRTLIHLGVLPAPGGGPGDPGPGDPGPGDPGPGDPGPGDGSTGEVVVGGTVPPTGDGGVEGAT